VTARDRALEFKGLADHNLSHASRVLHKHSRKDNAMNAKDVLNAGMDLGEHVLKTYVSDLSDAELLTRPGPGSNHLAWQLGHLIQSEKQLLEMVCPGAGAEFPAGFGDQHSKESIGSDDPAKFLTKAKYLELFDLQRAATKAALDQLPDADLDKPGPPNFTMCPTVGLVFNLLANHGTMHSGQFAAARRALGKPVLI
jgi:uncharacterized damage-inducible protein DinB